MRRRKLEGEKVGERRNCYGIAGVHVGTAVGAAWTPGRWRARDLLGRGNRSSASLAAKYLALRVPNGLRADEQIASYPM